MPAPPLAAYQLGRFRRFLTANHGLQGFQQSISVPMTYDVSPGYFAAAGTPLLAGRDVSFTDTAKMPPVAVVNREFARRLFPGDHGRSGLAVGRYFKNELGHSIQIVGIAADGKNLTISEAPEAAAFFPILQAQTTATALIVRMRPDLSAASTNDMAASVRKTIHDLDPGVPLQESGA